MESEGRMGFALASFVLVLGAYFSFFPFSLWWVLLFYFYFL